VEIACGAGDIDSSRRVPLAILDPLYYPRRLGALGTVRALGGVHFLLAISGFGNLGHCDFTLFPNKKLACALTRRMEFAQRRAAMAPVAGRIA
jgi:hypothetical protein